jgi:hypothetical protein
MVIWCCLKLGHPKIQWLKAHFPDENSTNFFVGSPNFQAYRSKQIFDIWTDVWSGQRSRLKYVISTQAVPGQHRSESGTSWKSSKMMGVGHQKLGLN